MKIQIGVTSYELNMMPQTVYSEVVSDDFSDALGMISNIDYTIHIRNDTSKQTMQQTFFHEVTHGMLDEIGQMELSGDEGLVDALSKQIYAFVTRNNLEKILNHIADKYDAESHKKITAK